MTGGPQAERVDWIDAAKGLGIIVVVIGHVWYKSPIRDPIYLFHMPLFFVLAGWVYKPRPMGEFTRRQLLSLGVPYLVFLIGLYCADNLIELVRGREPWLHGWKGLGALVMGGSALTGPYAIFWFPPCLLAARLAQNAVCLKWPDPLGRAWVLIALGALAAGTAAGWATDISPLGLLTAPVALFLLWLGHALSRARLPTWLPWAALPLAVLALAFCPPLNMKFGDYGWPLLSLGGGIAVCLVLFRLAAIVPWLAPLGNMSLVIMYMHLPIIHFGTSFVPKWMLFIVALTIPYLCGMVLRLHPVTAFLFLGKPFNRAASA